MTPRLPGVRARNDATFISKNYLYDWSEQNKTIRVSFWYKKVENLLSLLPVDTPMPKRIKTLKPEKASV